MFKILLQKVDQKAATISGIKPRAEKKPATTDFLSELKLGITLRRVKNPENNPFQQQTRMNRRRRMLRAVLST